MTCHSGKTNSGLQVQLRKT